MDFLIFVWGIVVGWLIFLVPCLVPLIAIIPAEILLRKTRPVLVPFIPLTVFTLLFTAVALGIIYYFEIGPAVIVLAPVWIAVYIVGCTSLLRTSSKRRAL